MAHDNSAFNMQDCITISSGEAQRFFSSLSSLCVINLSTHARSLSHNSYSSVMKSSGTFLELASLQYC